MLEWRRRKASSGMRYLTELPEYLGRCLRRIDAICGVAIGIFFFLITYVANVDQRVSITISVAIIIFSLLEAGYGIYRQERIMRAERESHVRLTARLDSLSANMPDPGPDKSSLRVHVSWELWVDQDVSTDKLALNIIYVYRKGWWQFWKRVRYPQAGIPAKDYETTQYRMRIHAGDRQPYKGGAVFEYVGDKMERGDPHWLLELVLVTGMPPGEHRTPVFIDYDELHRRGTNPPL